MARGIPEFRSNHPGHSIGNGLPPQSQNQPAFFCLRQCSRTHPAKPPISTGLDKKRLNLTTPRSGPEHTSGCARIAGIAAEAKVQRHPRLKQSCPLTRQQYWVCKGYTPENAEGEAKSAEKAIEWAQTQEFLRSTSDPHRGIAGVTPGPHRLDTGHASRAEGKRQRAECGSKKGRPSSQVRHNQMVM